MMSHPHRPFPLSLPALHPLLVTVALIHISNLLKRLFLYSETVSAYMLKHTCRALLNNQDNGKSKVPFTVTSGWKEVENMLPSHVAGHRLWRTWLSPTNRNTYLSNRTTFSSECLPSFQLLHPPHPTPHGILVAIFIRA